MIRSASALWALTLVTALPLAGLSLWLAWQPEPKLLAMLCGISTLVVLAKAASYRPGR